MVEHCVPMSSLQAPHHVSKWRVMLVAIGVMLALLGLLWLVQGAGTVQLRPILCVSNCKPVTRSVGWLIAGVLVCAAGMTLPAVNARHLHRR